jgi:hypothetical protein
MYLTTIEAAFAYYTECNLATLSGLLGKKSSGRLEKERQQSICDGMVYHCKAHGIDPKGMPRLMGLMQK